jgi:hypothetical protein
MSFIEINAFNSIDRYKEDFIEENEANQLRKKNKEWNWMK